MKRISLVFAIAATLLFAACQKEEATPTATTAPAATPAEPTPAPAPTDTTAAPADPTAAATDTMAPAETSATTAPASTAEPLGVPECDDYLTKYEACLAAHVPAESRDALRQSLDATRAGWAQAIAAGGKDQLAAACTTMRESARASLQAYGCSDF